jgi:hypothetical protein
MLSFSSKTPSRCLVCDEPSAPLLCPTCRDKLTLWIDDVLSTGPIVVGFDLTDVEFLSYDEETPERPQRNIIDEIGEAVSGITLESLREQLKAAYLDHQHQWEQDPAGFVFKCTCGASVTATEFFDKWNLKFAVMMGQMQEDLQKAAESFQTLAEETSKLTPLWEKMNDHLQQPKPPTMKGVKEAYSKYLKTLPKLKGPKGLT